MLQITLSMALLHVNKPLPESQYAQYLDPGTDAAVWYVAIIIVINYTCAFPVQTWSHFNTEIPRCASRLNKKTHSVQHYVSKSPHPTAVHLPGCKSTTWASPHSPQALFYITTNAALSRPDNTFTLS